MANEIVVRVGGDDDLTDVADKAQKNVSESVDKMASDVAAASQKMRSEGASSFDGVRDGADKTERRFIGLKDSITGTGDVMKGLKDGDVLTLTMGLADLAGSVANLGADLLDWGKKGLEAGMNAARGAAASTAAALKDAAAWTAHKAASIASTAATQAQTAAQWLLNAAMNANPIMLVVIAIAALVAGLVIAYKESETFRDIVNGAFNAVKDVVMGVSNWVKENWPLLLAILTGPFGLAVLAIVKHWDDIKNKATEVKDWIGDRVDEIVGFFTGIPGRIGDLGTQIGDGIKAGITAAYDAIRSVVNAIKLPSITIGGWNTPFGKTPSWTSPEIDPIPDLPAIRLARGGITNGPMLAIVGDNPGGREAIVPLPPGGGGAGLGTTIVVQGDVYGFDDFARKVRDANARNDRKGI